MKKTGAILGVVIVIGVLVVLLPMRLKAEDGGIRKFQECLKIADVSRQKACIATEAQSVMMSDGLPETVAKLTAFFSAEPRFTTMCHDIAHAVGHAAYTLQSQGTPVHSSGNLTFCGYGFYHGYMEFLISKRDSPAKATAFCDALTGDTQEPRLNCYHGIGHGAVIQHDIQIADPWTKVPPGVAMCESLHAETQYIQSCVDGVIDGVASEITGGEFPVTPEIAAHPYTICTKLKASYQSSCHTVLSWLVLYVSGQNFSNAAEKIAHILPPSDQAGVISTLASLDVRLILSGLETRDPAESCGQLTPGLRTPCVRGFATGYTLHAGEPGREYERGFAYCQNTGLNDSEKQACYDTVTSVYASLSGKSRIQEACSALPTEYQSRCSAVYQ